MHQKCFDNTTQAIWEIKAFELLIFHVSSKKNQKCFDNTTQAIWEIKAFELLIFHVDSRNATKDFRQYDGEKAVGSIILELPFFHVSSKMHQK